MSALGEAARARRAQIVALSLTELMLLLVFMSIAFTFLSKEEGMRDIPKVQKDLEKAQADLRKKDIEIASLRKQLVALRQENTRLNDYIKVLLGSSTSITPDAGYPPPGYNLNQLRALAREQRAIISALQQRIAQLEAKANGGRAPGLPICVLTAHYLVHFTLEADGTISGAPGWTAEMAFITKDVPGLDQLASRKPLDPNDFRAAAGRVKAWGIAQTQPCTVRVSYSRNTTDAGILERQLSAIGDSFYMTRVNR